MTLDEREHVYRLAGHDLPERTLGGTHVAPGLQRVLGSVTHAPAFIVSGVDIALSQNAVATALFGDHTQYQGDERSGIFRWFIHPET